MISKTTKPNKYGWYYTFKFVNDCITIHQKRKEKGKVEVVRGVQIFGDYELDIFMSLIEDFIEGFEQRLSKEVRNG